MERIPSSNRPKARRSKDLVDALICIGLAGLFVLLSSGAAFSQGNVGINNPTPHAKSLLDLTSSDKGLLAPRMTVAQRTAMFPAADATAEGMLVYQTDGTSGFYYYDGTAWICVNAGAMSNDWARDGNAGTNAATEFIGTTDAQPLVVRTNNVERVRVQPNGNVGIGTNAPVYNLEVASPAQSVARLTSAGNVWGSVLELKNTTAGTNYLGAVNFNDVGGSVPGQIAYHPVNGMTLATANTERMRITPTGSVGIGTNAPITTLDMAAPMVTSRHTSSNSIWGSVVELKNTTSGTNVLGAINFNNAANGFPGQLAYHPTDGMTLRSGGAERVRIQPNGNVGIGTNAPLYNLDVAAPVQAVSRITSGGHIWGSVLELRNMMAGPANLGAINFNDAANSVPAQIAYHTTNGLVIGVGGAERLRVQNNGYVGMGTTTPLDALHVVGNIRMVDGTQAAGKVLTSDANGRATWQSPSGSSWGLLGNAGTNPAVNFLGTTDAQPLVMRTNDTERMRILPNGNIGMGTTAPAYNLDIAAATQAVTRLTSTGTVWGSVLEVKNTTAGANYLGALNFNDATGNVPGQIAYHSANGLTLATGNTERMRVLPNGNAGFGTTAPASKLHVSTGSAGYAPNAQSGLTVEGSGNVYANVISGTGASGVLFGSSANSASGGVLYNANGGYANALELRTGGNITRMSITDQGSVTIGTASFSNSFRFNVFGTQAGALACMWNTDNAGVSGTTYMSSAPAVAGTTGWANASSAYCPGTLLHGTYGNTPVTFMTNSAERMRIAGNGNVGIKTATPTADLEVNGFTKLGSNAPAIKYLKVAGTTAATQGGQTLIPHGLVASKILGVSVLVEHVPGAFIGPDQELAQSAGYTYSYAVGASDITIINETGNSIMVLGKPVKVLITYEQ